MQQPWQKEFKDAPKEINRKELYPKEVRLAEDHVNWFLQTIKPLLVTHFVHGYKHGLEDKCIK